MPSVTPRALSRSRPDNGFARKVESVICDLVNPVDLFSGAKLDDVLLAQNVVVFKRISAQMLKPRGITHNYHHRFELVIPLRAAGRIHVDGVGYTLRPGQVFLVFPHQFHHYLGIESSQMCWLFVTFELSREQQLLALRNSPRVVGAEEGELIRVMMKEYVRPASEAERSLNLIVKVSSLIRRLSIAPKADCAVSREQQTDDPRGTLLQTINRYVRANLHRPLTIGDLANHTGYSISHLRAVFRREFKVSLGSYMRDSRLSIAASLLTRPERDSIENISKACGFVSIFAFSRAFKNAMGLSPSAYSKSIKLGSTLRD